MEELVLKGIEEIAMLSHVKIHFYGFRKHDREVSDAAADKFDADHDSGRYNKSLIEREGIKYLRNVMGDIRRYHRRNTLPWSDEGPRVLRSSHFTEYSRGLQKRIQEFDKAADDFCSKQLPELYSKAKKKLGKMWKAEDYPDISTVRSRYKVEVQITPIPLSKDFRVTGLGKKDLDKIKSAIEKSRQEAAKEAMKELWERLKTPIEKMANVLVKEDTKFRDSLVKNVTSIVELVPKLNIGDPNLDKFAKEVESKLCSVDPKALRKNKKVRKETSMAAKALLDKMAAYC